MGSTQSLYISPVTKGSTKLSGTFCVFLRPRWGLREYSSDCRFLSLLTTTLSSVLSGGTDLTILVSVVLSAGSCSLFVPWSTMPPILFRPLTLVPVPQKTVHRAFDQQPVSRPSCSPWSTSPASLSGSCPFYKFHHNYNELLPHIFPLSVAYSLRLQWSLNRVIPEALFLKAGKSVLCFYGFFVCFTLFCFSKW